MRFKLTSNLHLKSGQALWLIKENFGPPALSQIHLFLAEQYSSFRGVLDMLGFKIRQFLSVLLSRELIIVSTAWSTGSPEPHQANLFWQPLSVPDVQKILLFSRSFSYFTSEEHHLNPGNKIEMIFLARKMAKKKTMKKSRNKSQEEDKVEDKEEAKKRSSKKPRSNQRRSRGRSQGRS